MLVTVEELSDFLELDTPPENSADDRRATRLIEWTSGAVLGYLGRPTLEAEDAVALVDGTGSTVLLLPADHVLDVVSVVEDPRGTALELEDDSAFEWNSDGIFTRIDGALWRRRARWYEITFSFGLGAVEVDTVKGIVCRVAARAVVNPEALATENMGGYVSGFAFDETRMPTLAAPDRRDLDRYAVSGAASSASLALTSAGS